MADGLEVGDRCIEIAAASGIPMLATKAGDYIGNPFRLIKFPAIALALSYLPYLFLMVQGALAAGNERYLKWKRYLFLTLGQRLGEVDLRPPKCGRCDEFAKCFADGPPPAPGPVAGRYP